MTNSGSLLIYVVRNYAPSDGRDATTSTTGAAGSSPFINVRIAIHISSGTLVTRHQRLRILSNSILSNKSVGCLIELRREILSPTGTVARRAAIVIDYREAGGYGDTMDAQPQERERERERAWIARDAAHRDVQRIARLPWRLRDVKRRARDNYHHCHRP